MPRPAWFGLLVGVTLATLTATAVEQQGPPAPYRTSVHVEGWGDVLVEAEVLFVHGDIRDADIAVAGVVGRARGNGSGSTSSAAHNGGQDGFSPTPDAPLGIEFVFTGAPLQQTCAGGRWRPSGHQSVRACAHASFCACACLRLHRRLRRRVPVSVALPWLTRLRAGPCLAFVVGGGAQMQTA